MYIIAMLGQMTSSRWSQHGTHCLLTLEIFEHETDLPAHFAAHLFLVRQTNIIKGAILQPLYWLMMA